MKNRKGPWAAISTEMLRNPPVSTLKPQQKLLYLASILDCSELHTDGLIRKERVPYLLVDAGAKKVDVSALVSARLWYVIDDPEGWAVAKYLEWQPSRIEWEARKEKERTRKAEWRNKNRDYSGRYATSAQEDSGWDDEWCPDGTDAGTPDGTDIGTPIVSPASSPASCHTVYDYDYEEVVVKPGSEAEDSHGWRRGVDTESVLASLRVEGGIA